MRQKPDAFNCKTCQHQHCDSNNPASFKKWKIEGVIESNTCLLPMVTPYTRKILQLKEHYAHGHLPWAGGVFNQPNKFLQALEIIGYG